MKTFSELKTLLEDAGDKYENLLFITQSGETGIDNPSVIELERVAKKLGLKCFIADVDGAYVSEEDGKLFIYSFPVDEKGVRIDDDKIADSGMNVKKSFPLDKETTVVLPRALSYTVTPYLHSLCDEFEHRGFKMFNSIKCSAVCADKYLTDRVLSRNNIQVPKTIAVAHANGADDAVKRAGLSFPLVLKTSNGSQGIGVVVIESERQLSSVVQVLYKKDPAVTILLQEFIKSDYDVRVVVINGKIIGAVKRFNSKKDIRTNLSQGQDSEEHILTELEKEEVLNATKVLGGTYLGIDFIPAKTSKDRPLFIEGNTAPGVMGTAAALGGDKFLKAIIEELMNK